MVKFTSALSNVEFAFQNSFIQFYQLLLLFNGITEIYYIRYIELETTYRIKVIYYRSEVKKNTACPSLCFDGSVHTVYY